MIINLDIFKRRFQMTFEKFFNSIPKIVIKELIDEKNMSQSDFDKEFQIHPAPHKVNLDKCKIYMDTQEAHIIPTISKILMKEFDRTNIWIQRLTVGDVLIISPDGTYEVILERKTVTDLVASMKDGRSVYQMYDLADHDNGFLVVIGDYNEMSEWERTRFNSQDSITRYIGKLAFESNPDGNRAGFIPLPDHRQFAILIDYLARKIEEGKYHRTRKDNLQRKKFGVKKIDYNDPKIIRDTQIQQIARIGLINVKTALKIMEHFKWNYKTIQNAPISDLQLVDGV